MKADGKVFRVAEKWGFGMSRPKPGTQQNRSDACATLLALIESTEIPSAIDSNLEAISTVKGLFNRIGRQDQWDWFTVAGQLGYPSGSISMTIGSQLSLLRSAIKEQATAAFAECRSTLLRLPVRRCLSVFLGHARIKDEPGAGWIYVLSTRHFREFLKVGMTTRNIEERVREINRATGIPIPYGVRRCWRVSDPIKAEKLAHTTLAEFRVRNDREFFNAPFEIAAKMLDTAIREHSLEIRTLNALTALGSAD
jgi:hypothetical protein